MTAVLIVEDETRIAAFLDKGLRAAGYTTTIESSGARALNLALTGEHDMILLDLGLPDVDGFTVLRRLREAGSRVPVIVLTARSSLEDTVTGLDGGADDYMTKPLRFAELLARIRLRLDHTRAHPAEPSVLRAGDLALDLRTRRAQINGHDIDLSAREFALTETFLRHPGQVLSREQLLTSAWGHDFDPTSNVVDVYVGYLRAKLGTHRITTIRGMGYRLHTTTP